MSSLVFRRQNPRYGLTVAPAATRVVSPLRLAAFSFVALVTTPDDTCHAAAGRTLVPCTQTGNIARRDPKRSQETDERWSMESLIPKLILVPTDLSEPAAHALRYASRSEERRVGKECRL